MSEEGSRGLKKRGAWATPARWRRQRPPRRGMFMAAGNFGREEREERKRRRERKSFKKWKKPAPSPYIEAGPVRFFFFESNRSGSPLLARWTHLRPTLFLFFFSDSYSHLPSSLLHPFSFFFFCFFSSFFTHHIYLFYVLHFIILCIIFNFMPRIFFYFLYLFSSTMFNCLSCILFSSSISIFVLHFYFLYFYVPYLFFALHFYFIFMSRILFSIIFIFCIALLFSFYFIFSIILILCLAFLFLLFILCTIFIYCFFAFHAFLFSF